MDTPTITLAIAVATALLGLWMLRRAWRGRRVGDHPYCRQCEFDLFGQPTGSQRCPECGADIHKPGAVATGERHRRPRLATLGAIILLFGIAGSAVMGLGLAEGVAWERYKPVMWLIRDGRSDDGIVRSTAITELLRRQQAGLLSTRQVSAVVDAALKVQGDRSMTWDTRWGDLIEAARASNGASDAQWRKYAEQAVTTDFMWLSVTARVSTREVPQTFLDRRKARVGRAPGLFAYCRALTIIVGDREYRGLMDDRDGSDSREISSSGSGGGGGTRDDLRRALRGLPPGKHTGYIVYEVRVTPQPQSIRTLRQAGSAPDRKMRPKEYSKLVQAEQLAAWSDAGRASAVAVIRLQFPFQIELYEARGGELCVGYDPSTRARPAEPVPPEIEKLVDARVARETEARNQLLSVDPADIAAAAGMLEQGESGVIKLLPHKKYPQELLGMHGAGAYYDFARPSQHYRTGREICLRDGKLTCYYGFLLELGDRSPTEVVNLSDTPPPWADDTITRRWSDFWGPSEQLPPDLAASLGKSEQRGGPGGVPAQAQRAYLFRSIDDIIKSDILVGLRVLRICDDGSAVIAYRILKEFAHPGRQ